MIATGHIYKIICLIDDSFCYIGSTFDTLHKRFAIHKSNYKQYLNNNQHLITIFPYFTKYGIENFKIIKIKSYKVYRENKKDRKHLEVYETLWINKSKNCINKYLPFNPLYKIDYKNNLKHYYQNNKESIKAKVKKYKLINKEKIKESGKEYREKNKEKISEKNKEKIKCDICNKQMNKSSLNKHKKNIHKSI